MYGLAGGSGSLGGGPLQVTPTTSSRPSSLLHPDSPPGGKGAILSPTLPSHHALPTMTDSGLYVAKDHLVLLPSARY